MLRVIPPSDDPDDRHFWEGVARGELLIQKCSDCNVLRHPPSPMCSECSSLEWSTQAASGRARIVALLDLEEGIRFVSNLVDIDLPDVSHGLPVRLEFVEIDTVMLPQFAPLREES
jgi:uncharacterized OB-fold protein